MIDKVTGVKEWCEQASKEDRAIVLANEHFEKQGKAPLYKPLDRYQGHGTSFIRACCHLLHRIVNSDHGPLLPPRYLTFAGETYGLSDPLAYWRALKGELAESPDRSIRETINTEPPRELAVLFETDCKNAMQEEKAKQ